MDTPRIPTSLRLCGPLSLVLLAALPLAPLATRFGLIGWQIGLPLTALAIVGSALVLLALLVLLFLPSMRPFRALTAAIAGVALAPVMAGALVVLPARELPVIHDISTDLADPPAFADAIARRGPASNPLTRGPEIDAQQKAGYPDLAGIDTALSPQAALPRAREVAQKIGWQIHAEDAATGMIEASQTTFWFGFVDDIAIRVRATPTGSRVDLRSVSRVGKGDLGANAARIRRFEAAFSAPSG